MLSASEFELFAALKQRAMEQPATTFEVEGEAFVKIVNTLEHLRRETVRLTRVIAEQEIASADSTSNRDLQHWPVDLSPGRN